MQKYQHICICMAFDNYGCIRLDRLLIFINFMLSSSVFFPVEPENDIRFLDKSIIKYLFNFKVKLSLFNTEETKSLIIPIHHM